VSRVDHLVEEFSEQNLLLQMLLGVLSETDRVARLLPRPKLRAVRPSAVRSVDGFVAALLGIVSFRQQIQIELSADSTVRNENDAGPTPAATDISPDSRRRRRHTIRELMR
jgi:hypothetical protein